MSIVSPIVNVIEINIPRKAAPKKRRDLISGCKKTARSASFLVLGLPNISVANMVGGYAKVDYNKPISRTQLFPETP